jgi:NADPH:quinone reductase-like Zn-dependent oxidoreductase
VYATTVNRTDCANLTARPFIMRFVTGLFRPRDRTPGTDFAGRVEAVGPGVTRFAVGDRICGFDDSGLSSQAELMTRLEGKPTVLIPGNVTWAQAVASVEGAHYARNIINKVRLQAGQTVLVIGATGAIGSALVQFLLFHGLHVTAVCGTEGLETVRAMGVDRVIDYRTQDFTTDASQYDFVFDAVGKSTFFRCRRLLGPRGVYASTELGPWLQNLWLAALTPLRGGRRVVFPIPTGTQESLAFARARLEDGTFTPVIDRTYSIDQIRDAYEYVRSGQKIGNVILEP